MFKWFGGKQLPRPDNPLKVKDIVFDLTKSEWDKEAVIYELGNTYLCLNKNYDVVAAVVDGKTKEKTTEDGTLTNVYEIVYKTSSTYYSVLRLETLQECKDVFDQMNTVLNEVVPNVSEKKQQVFSEKLQNIVKCLKENPNWTSAHVAAFCGIDKMFLDKHEKIVENINKQVQPDYLTPLQLAVQSGKVHLVSLILNFKPDLKLTDKKLNSMYHYAILSTFQMFHFMLKLKEAPEMLRWVNKTGCTPAHLACFGQKFDNLRELMKFGCSVYMLTLGKPKSLDQITKDKLDDDTKIIYFGKDILDDLDTIDMKYGGTPLHWVKNRRSLDKLIDMGFRLDVENIIGETALHCMIKRHRLKCTIGLLCFGANVDHKTSNGDTPVFYAVKEADISATQAMAIFDCDINAKNYLGITPRHLAATGDHPDHSLVLYVLSAIGAKRCEKGQLNCTDGCSYNGTTEGTRYHKWPKYDNEFLYKKVILENIIQDAIKKKQDEMNEHDKKAKSKSASKQSDKTRVRMLCFDGGGIRGLIILQMILEVEKRLKYPLESYFDWVAGTSTGSIISTMLCEKKRVRDMLGLYFRFKDKVLTGSRPYNSTNLENLLKDEIGANTTMREIKEKFHKNLIITATLVDRNPAQLHLFRSYPSPRVILAQTQVSDEYKPLPNPETQLAWEACRASGAAPTYFKAFKNFMDGGLIANNPTLDAMTEFKIHNDSLESIGCGNETEQLAMVLSIGTGREPLRPMQVVELEKMWSINPREVTRGAMYFKYMGELLIQQICNTEAHVVDRAMVMCSLVNVPYFRLNPPLSEIITTDETDDVELLNAIWETKAYMYAMRDQLKLIVDLLDGPCDVLGKKTQSKSCKNDKKVLKDVDAKMNQMGKEFAHDAEAQDMEFK